MTVYDPPSTISPNITIRALLDDPALELAARLVAGSGGLGRCIANRRIQKSGLAMVGHLHGIVPDRIQILGETELSFLESLTEEEQRRAARHLFSLELCCVVVTRGVMPPATFVKEAERTDTALIVCQERSSSAITQLHSLLDERLAPRTRIHGVLVDVFEVGVLILGKSGIGKSECALELVMAGHRLVADDVVECDYRPPGMIFGEPNEMLRHHMEVRGLGILDIKELYGVTAIRERKRVDLVVQLEFWDPNAKRHFDRLGLEARNREILGVPIREVRLPVRPGRTMSSIIQIAARHELLRQAGHDSARDFVEKIESSIQPSESGAHDPTLAREGDSLAATRSQEGSKAQKPLESSVPPPVVPSGSPASVEGADDD